MTGTVLTPVVLGHPKARRGMLIVLVFATLAVVAPLLAHDPYAMRETPFERPSTASFFGADNLGRDIFSRVVYGAQTSLMVGILVALASTTGGIVIGALAGYYGAIVDDFLMRFTELFQVVPRFVLAIVTVALFGATVWNVIAVTAVLSWPGTARLVRSQFLSLRSRDFVQAARALGVPDARVIVREMLPNAMPPIIVEGSFQIANAILIEAGLSFLGLGDPNKVSWGQMLQQAQPFLRQAWWLAAFPGAAISALVLGLNMLGDGLNDLLDPRRRKAV